MTSARGEESVAGTSLGKSAIQGRISALEFFRRIHAEDHPDEKDAQIPLRSTPSIRELETTIKSNVAARVVSAQILKASGSTSGKYRF